MIKNTKNKIQDVNVNAKFLHDQSRFRWDHETQIVTADDAAWDELIQAHTFCQFGKLRDKSFALYDLAYQVFSRTFATAEMAEVKNILDFNSIPLANITPTNQAAKHHSKGTKQLARIIDPAERP
ncbi:hypothetical protein VP01_1276g5 [Puccinia sorghi]|uniref:Myb/SANT-like domain-containing protein n=1 Tax=Puccinia sorghi TaxID=27349 RepID=A0A0L6VNU5_9BASI|nr:hypothetical protein VP01_1276g5 [Puccinia sorghi]